MIDQKTAALLIATANTAAQLVQLRKAKPFSMFDNDYTGFRHINADFDNGCRDKQLRCAIAECLHRAIAFTSFHFAMRKGNSDIGKGVRQRGKPVFSRGNVQLVRFFNKRANPIGAFSRAKRAAKARVRELLGGGWFSLGASDVMVVAFAVWQLPRYCLSC